MAHTQCKNDSESNVCCVLYVPHNSRVIIFRGEWYYITVFSREKKNLAQHTLLRSHSCCLPHHCIYMWV